MRLKLIFGNDEKDHELHRRVVECVEFDPGAGTAKRRHHFFQPVRGAMRNGNPEADTGAHRFFALFERSQNSLTIFRFDLATRHQQIHQLHDGIPAFGRLHFRDDLISGKKLSQRHADSSGAGSLSCRFRMTRSIWRQSTCRSEPQENLKIAINRARGALASCGLSARLRGLAQFIIESAREKPAHAKHINGGAESAVTQAVFALAETTRAMIYWNLNQPISCSFYKRRDETMHALERNKRRNAIPPHRLQRATGVANAIPRKSAADKISDATSDAFQQSVLTLRAIPTYQIGAARNLREQTGNIGRIILQIAIN